MKLRRCRASELNPRSVVVPIEDVVEVIKRIKSICETRFSDEDKVDIIKRRLEELK